MATTIHFKKEKSNKVATVNIDDCIKLSCSIGCIASVASAIETLLEEIDLDNITNTQFRLSTIYGLCYLLEEYAENLSNIGQNLYTQTNQ